jgi:hypothetical protein
MVRRSRVAQFPLGYMVATRSALMVPVCHLPWAADDLSATVRARGAARAADRHRHRGLVRRGDPLDGGVQRCRRGHRGTVFPSCGRLLVHRWHAVSRIRPGRLEHALHRRPVSDDSTLIVESFKDSTFTGSIDTTRYEARRDGLTNPGASRYVATVITPDRITFGPLVGVRNGFTWRKGDDTSWIAAITPLGGGASAQRRYRMVRLK